MVLQAQLEEDPLQKIPGNIRLISVDTKRDSNASAGGGYSFEFRRKATFATFPDLKKLCVEIKPTIDMLNNKFKRIAVSQQTVEQLRTKFILLHGLFLMFLGGSWVRFATFTSFCVLYDVFEDIRTLNLRGDVASMKTVLKSLNNLLFLVVVYVALLTIPLLSKVTIAFMLEKYVVGSIYTPDILTQLEK